MHTFNKKFYVHFLAYTLFFIFCFTIRPSWGDAESQYLSKQSLELAIKKYDYANWKPKNGGVIPGVVISRDILTQLGDIPKVWKNDEYRIENIPTEPYSLVIIRKYWEEGENKLEVTMSVRPNFTLAKEYLITKYASTHMAHLVDRTPVLDIGEVCFVITGEKQESLSSIDLIRNNVVIMMRAEGNLTNSLKDMARKVDEQLKKNDPVPNYFQLKEIPWATLSCKQPTIKLGESVPLKLRVKNKNHRELRYFWELSGGGVEKDDKGNFLYYGGDPGQQTITVTVVNELGLQHSDSLDITVEK